MAEEHQTFYNYLWTVKADISYYRDISITSLKQLSASIITCIATILNTTFKDSVIENTICAVFDRISLPCLFVLVSLTLGNCFLSDVLVDLYNIPPMLMNLSECLDLQFQVTLYFVKQPLTHSVQKCIFMSILLTIWQFHTASETRVGI